ncbi:MAG TPA: OsmC family protein [Burkholderiales bacterium]|jgi:uncharacterized OsmC-like protein|nr:OsmC family protein [Burkholderiales bacterium]
MMTVREAIERISADIAADLSKAKARNAPATARLTEGLRCEVSGPTGQRMVTDMARALGGDASAPNPGWVLRCAWASCTATVIAMRAARLGVALETLEVTVDSDSDLRGILGLDENVGAGQHAVRTTVRIRGSADAQTLREIASWGEAHSPVGCTVRNSPACSLDIEVI